MIVISLSIWEEAKDDKRKGPSLFENMPFLGAEDALLETRRASSIMIFVRGWFIVCYSLVFKRWYTPTLSVFTSMSCKDTLRLYRLFWKVEKQAINSDEDTEKSRRYGIYCFFKVRLLFFWFVVEINKGIDLPWEREFRSCEKVVGKNIFIYGEYFYHKLLLRE